MNHIFILDSTHTPYESNRSITLSNDLVDGAETVTSICVDYNGGTFSSGGNNSVIAGGCNIMVLSATCADGTSLKKTEEFGNASPVVFDSDIQRKVSSCSNISDEQRITLSLAFQYNKDKYYHTTIITNSETIRSILIENGISVISYESSGIPYGWTCYRWNK